MILNIPTLVAMVTLVCYCGLVMFAYYADCDPLKAGMVQDRDQVNAIVPILLDIFIFSEAPGHHTLLRC